MTKPIKKSNPDILWLGKVEERSRSHNCSQSHSPKCSDGKSVHPMPSFRHMLIHRAIASYIRQRQNNGESVAHFYVLQGIPWHTWSITILSKVSYLSRTDRSLAQRRSDLSGPPHRGVRSTQLHSNGPRWNETPDVGTGDGVAAAPSPQNRTCDFHCIRLKHRSTWKSACFGPG